MGVKIPGKSTIVILQCLHHDDINIMESQGCVFSRIFKANFEKIECKQKDGALFKPTEGST